MSKKELAVSIGLGLLIGLPQGFSNIPQLDRSGLPLETLQITGGFGLFGGIIFGLLFMGRKDSEHYNPRGYLFFLVMASSIGVPKVAESYSGNLIHDITMPGLFFTSISLGMLSGGALVFLFKKIT